MINKSFQREFYIDFLKFIGSLLLILAHVQAPNYIIQLRDFDVIMMVFISAILSKKSLDRSYNKNFSYYKFIKKRFNRLILPTWLFLIFLFSLLFLVGQPLNISTMIKGFLFQRDSSIVGYVWVIWVYFACSIMAPILYKIKTNKGFILWILIYLLYEIFSQNTILVNSRLIYYTFFVFVPYGFITFIGMKFEYLSRKMKSRIIVVTTIIWLSIATFLYYANGFFQLTNMYKYPVRSYYLTYGLPITILLIEFFSKLNLQIYRNNIVVFVSKSSLWIYLWHIFYINLFNFFIEISDWRLKFLIVVFFSLLTTFIQEIIVSRLENLTGKNFFYNLLKG